MSTWPHSYGLRGTHLLHNGHFLAGHDGIPWQRRRRDKHYQAQAQRDEAGRHKNHVGRWEMEEALLTIEKRDGILIVGHSTLF